MMLFSYERVRSLSESELEVYHCILKLEDKILDMKIRELAQSAYVSVTVVWNFCKKMECNGWTEFKIRYKESLQDKNVDCDESNESKLIDKYITCSYHDNKEEQEKLNQVMIMMSQARKIIFIGAGMSGVMAKYGAMYLTNLGKLAQYLDTSFYSIPSEDHTDTVVISLSVSGITPIIINHSSTFKKLGARVIAITNNVESELAQIVNLSLFYGTKQEDALVLGQKTVMRVDTSTQVAVIHLIETISKGCMKNC